MDTITTTPVLADLPARDVLTIDGVGSPESPAFQAAIRALVVVRAALGGRDDEQFEGSYAQDGDPTRFDLHAPDGRTGGCSRPHRRRRRRTRSRRRPRGREHRSSCSTRRSGQSRVSCTLGPTRKRSRHWRRSTHSSPDKV